jgi:hypothetical protein
VPGIEVIATVAEQVHHLHQVQALQFLQAGADVGARHLQHFGDALGMQRRGREEQQRMHLRDGAVDTPARAHLAPVHDEAALDLRQRVDGQGCGGNAHARGCPGLAAMVRPSYISVKTEMSDEGA